MKTQTGCIASKRFSAVQRHPMLLNCNLLLTYFLFVFYYFLCVIYSVYMNWSNFVMYVGGVGSEFAFVRMYVCSCI